MSLPLEVRSQIDPAAVTKVTRLFNNSIGDVLSELIQNGRRAGASRIDLSVTEAEDARYLIIRDDGVGIEDPSVILALGRSGWSDSVARREDPAGMGVFSLAGRPVEIRSRARGAPSGWRIRIGAGDWESGNPIPVEPCACAVGTEIRIPLDTTWHGALDAAARNAARHCPIPVQLNGEPLKQQDWLAGAVVIVEDEGVRIGLFNDHQASRYSPSINFHGVIVACALPSIAERDRRWSARVDIVDAPALQLVLPARKEMVQNEALGRLRETIRRIIFLHIESLGSHRLPHAQWGEAADLGVTLPEARAELDAWTPAMADHKSLPMSSTRLPADDLVLVEHFGAAIEQCGALAIDRDGRFDRRLAAPDETMAGYAWYDRLPRITNMAFEIERAGEIFRLDPVESPAVESGVVDRLDLKLTITGPTPETLFIPAPVAIDYDDSSYWSFEEAHVLLASPEAVKPGELVELLVGACFSSSDDSDADSWDTQHDRFLLDAREMATRLLLGDDAALIERLRAILAYRAQWFVPEGKRFLVVIGRDTMDVRIEPAPEV